MARSALLDPLDKFRWIVEIDGFTRNGFTSCSTPSYRIQERNYAEGGAHLNPRVIVNGIVYNPVTMERGVTNDTSFLKWATGFIDLHNNNQALQESGAIQQAGSNLASGDILGAVNSIMDSNGGAGQVSSSSDYPFSYRRDVVIKHVNRLGQIVVVYTLYRAFPIAFKPASDFNAEGDDGLSIESITLGYEGFDVRPTGIAGLVGNIAAANMI